MSRLGDVLTAVDAESHDDPQPNIEDLQVSIQTYFEWLGRALERRERVARAQEDDNRASAD
jgi:hypothetical protein